jgi:hypothetical protein
MTMRHIDDADEAHRYIHSSASIRRETDEEESAEALIAPISASERKGEPRAPLPWRQPPR